MAAQFRSIMGNPTPKRRKTAEPAGGGDFLAGIPEELNGAWLASVIAASQDAIMSTSPDGVFLSWNPGAERLYGYRANEIIGRHVSILVPEDRRGEIARIVEVVGKGKRLPPFETVRRRKDGTLVDVELTLSPVLEGNRVVAVMALGRDITERKDLQRVKHKRADEALLVSEERLRLVLQASEIGVFEIDLRTKVSHWNDTEYALLGLAPGDGEPGPDTFFKFVHPDDRDRLASDWYRALESGEYDTEFRIVRADGSERWLSGKGRFAHEGGGRSASENGSGPTRFLGVNMDITERRKAQIALQLRKAQLLSFVQHAPAAIAMFDREMNYLATSQRWVSDYANERRDLAGLNHYEVFPDLPEWWKEIHRKGMAGERLSNDDDLWVHEDGSNRWLRWSVNPWTDADGNIGGIMILSEDISGKKQAEQALVENRQRLNGIIESAMDAIISVNAAQQIILFNAAAEKMFRCKAEEAIGGPLDRFIPTRFRTAHTKHHRRFVSNLVTSRTMGRLGTVSGLRADGEEFPIEASISHIEVGGENVSTVILRDISERRRLEQEVIEISEMERQHIGQDLHDDLGQQLAGMWFFASSLEKHLRDESSPQAGGAAKIAAQLDKALALTRNLARGLQPVALEPDGLMASLRQLAASSAELFKIHCHFACPRPVLVQDAVAATNLYRITQEAVTNAARHGKAQHITIMLSSARRDLQLKVEDDGTGIAESTGPHDGMGIRTMKYRAETHGGSLVIQKRPGGGTSVLCTIPKPAKPAAAKH